MTESAQLFQNARQLADEGHWAQSLAIIQELVKNGEASAEHDYYVGLNKFKLGDLQAAASAFQRCLKADPNNANCNYWLGQIAASQNQTDFAQYYYSRALMINPQHGGASNELDKLRPKPVTVPAAPFRGEDTGGPMEMSDSEPGFYGLLLGDPSPIARQAIELIDSLEITERRPRLTAYLGRICFILFVLPFILFGYILIISYPVMLILGAVGPQTILSDSITPAIAASAFFAIVFLVVLIVRVRSRLVSFHQGRIKIIEGVLSKRWWNIELYRIVDLSIHQTFWNRLTGDGSLILYITESQGKNHRKICLRGLKEAAEMEVIFENLRNVVFLLRTGNWGKGIIY